MRTIGKKMLIMFVAVLFTSAAIPMGVTRVYANPYADYPTEEDMNNAAELELDKWYTLTGDDKLFHFKCPETGYYMLHTEGKDENDDDCLMAWSDISKWPGEGGVLSLVGYPFFMVKAGSYSGEYYLSCGVREKYKVKVTKLKGYDFITNDNNIVGTWEIEEKEGFDEEETKTFSIPFYSNEEKESLGLLQYKPIKITVPKGGTYRFEVTVSHGADHNDIIHPAILDEEGNVLVCNTGSGTYLPGFVRPLAAEMKADKSYYLFPDSLLPKENNTENNTDLSVTCSITCKLNDSAYYCTDGWAHSYKEIVDKQATPDESGSYHMVCTACGKTYNPNEANTENSDANYGNINKVDIRLESEVCGAANGNTFTYTGREIKPKVKVESTIDLVKDFDYTIEYSDNINVGKGSVTVTLNESEGSRYSGSKTIEFNIVKPVERETVDKVIISDFVEPVAGESPVIEGKLPDGAHYFINMDEDQSYWSDEKFVKLNNDAVFEEGKTYYAELYIDPQAGYQFMADKDGNLLTSVKINGRTDFEELIGIKFDTDETKYLEKDEDDASDGDEQEGGNDEEQNIPQEYIICGMKFVCKPAPYEEPEHGIYISDVQVNVTAPTAGTTSKTVPEAAVPSGKNYRVEAAGWLGTNGEYEPSEYTFEAGKNYTMWVTLKADDGYDFPDNVKADIAGGKFKSVEDVYNQTDPDYSGMLVYVEVTAADKTATDGDGKTAGDTSGGTASDGKISGDTSGGTTSDGKISEDTSGGTTSDGTSDSGNAPAVGTTEQDTSGTASYKVSDTGKDSSGNTVAKVTYVASAASEKKKTTITVPDTVTLADGTKAEVTSIAVNAFKKNTKIKKVTIGSNVETIGSNAFSGCSNLTSVTIKGNSLKTVNAGAFQNCKKLTKVTLGKNVKTIGKNAFNGCKALKTIKINGNKLTSVGKNAFKNVKKNANITVYSKDKKQYNKVVKKLKAAGAKKAKYSFKKKK